MLQEAGKHIMVSPFGNVIYDVSQANKHDAIPCCHLPQVSNMEPGGLAHMGQIRAGSEMAEMARLPLLPGKATASAASGPAQAQPSLAQAQAWPRTWDF